MENKVKVWIARDKCGALFAFSNVPLKEINLWSPGPDINIMQLKSNKFPSVKWEDDEPTEAYITLAETQEQSQPKIDWEQRRYEIAKEMGLELYRQKAVKPHSQCINVKDIADFAVAYTDRLIENLKKGGEQ